MFLLKSCSQRFGRYPQGGRPQRCLDFGFHFCYINNPGKPKFWHRRFASTERPETVPTRSSRPSVMKSKSLNYYGFAQITVPTAVPACAFSLGGAANSVFLLNCDFERNPRSLFMVFFNHFISNRVAFRWELNLVPCSWVPCGAWHNSSTHTIQSVRRRVQN